MVVAGDIGGAERLLVDLATRGPATGAEHTVALFTPNPKLRAYFERHGLELLDRGPVRENPLAYLWRSLGPRDAAWLAEAMRRRGTHIAHMHTLGSHVLGVRAARRAGVRTLRTEHHYVHYDDPSAAVFTRWAVQRTQSIVAISEFVRAQLAEKVPSATPRVRVVRNGVDASAFAAAPHPGATSGPLRIAMACRLEAWKGVDLAVSALGEAPDATLTVAGEGTERPRLERLARERGVGDRVRFLGRSEDVRQVFADAECTVNASEQEPLGLSVLESLAVGRPVVAFAEGGIPEIVEDGVTGFLASPRSAAALAGAIRRAGAARGRLAAMGAAGRAFVDAGCTVERMCAGYAAAYAELAP